jgi:ATP-binding cassette subfamily B protein
VLSPRPGLRLLWRHAALHPWPLAGAAALTLAFVAGDLAGPLVVREMIRLLSLRIEARDFLVLAALAAVVYLGRALTNAGLAWINGHLSQAVRSQVRGRVFDHLLLLPPGFHAHQRVGGLVSTIVQDVAELDPLLAVVLPDLLIDLLLLAGGAAILLTLNAPLAAVVVVPLAILFFLFRRFSREIGRATGEEAAATRELSARLAEALLRVEAIQALTREELERARFRTAIERCRQLAMARQRVFLARYPLAEVLGNLTTVGVVVVGAVLLSRGRIALPELVAFVLYAGFFFRPLVNLVRLLETAQRGLASADHVAQLLALRSEVPEPAAPRPLARFTPTVELSQVTFAYPGRPSSLDRLDLVLPALQTTAIVGASGAGKSTLLRLLMRFYDPQSGAVRLSGVDVRELALGDLRRRFAVVHQEPALFEGTVAENIGYGRDQATRDDVQRAARLAGAHEFILALPDGYDTLVGERGARLSGGQRQRLALSRALVREAPLLLLDEPTAALDPETEASIGDTLRALEGRFTVVIVAHRQAIVRCAPRIVVLEGGRIVEQGTHEQLRSAGGRYRALMQDA